MSWMLDETSILIGDVHGHFDEYRQIIRTRGANSSIQLGDMGIGFAGDGSFNVSTDHRFIRGNHDSPRKCEELPHYLGNFGYLENETAFFVSGAFSIDRRMRIEGISWWRDEELGYMQSQLALDAYIQARPQVVLSHDCPLRCYDEIHSHHGEKTRTNTMLQSMYDEHHPDLWVFGHHHVSRRFRVGRTQFICLAELESANYWELLGFKRRGDD